MQSILEYNAQIESYRYIFYFSLIVGLVFAVLTILLCVVFRVDEVFGDITGAYRRKAIKKHKDDTASGSVSRGQMTQNSARRNVYSRSKVLGSTEEITYKLRGTAKLESTAKLGNSNDMDETVPLSMVNSAGDETVLLNSNITSDETMLLSGKQSDMDETVVLKSNSDETDKLSSNVVTLEEDIVVSSTKQYL